MQQWQKYIECSPEVREAIFNDQALVALESTIISHGMPYPLNVKTANEGEEIIRENGAVPATIGIIEGKIKIGLTSEELDYFGSAENIEKVSRRDFPYILSQKKNGATTVAGTMICASLAEIRIFVTGGIGGVHRGVSESWDISADLTELMQTNVGVVCAGVKSILDIGKTLEYLETCGVPVISYKSREFPAFYTPKSGFYVENVMNSPLEIAELLKAKWDLGLKGGVVIANPIPEEYAMPENEINQAITDALEEAAAKNITGKNITPFLLAKVKEITGGRSLEANIALVKNNALLGARIAKAKFH